MIEPIKIDCNALYDVASIRLNLGLSTSAVDKARKSGELKSTRRGGRQLYLGRWIQEWLTAEPAEAVRA
jgi:hypothetical protein